MEVIQEIIIRNIPNVPNNRDLILTLLKSRCRELGLSFPLYADVVQSAGRLPCHGFTCLKRIDDNEVLLDQRMYFEEIRLLFEVQRVAVIDQENMAGWLGRRHPQLLRSQDESGQDPPSQMLPEQQ
ncbi:hypothetical protein BpHYR1_051799 [Brachionus plicatilis]|uniref:Uncharacterized protein n=1 Tax=Brachionus plicatilis TaxID=10195 RepID=A0A3M7P995_BRAPC|nr:hypothetical protein BpHYR1_051799 [Brachionus plicatilis]